MAYVMVANGCRFSIGHVHRRLGRRRPPLTVRDPKPYPGPPPLGVDADLTAGLFLVDAGVPGEASCEGLVSGGGFGEWPRAGYWYRAGATGADQRGDQRAAESMAEQNFFIMGTDSASLSAVDC